jgi:hypothetical protein
MHIMHGSTAHRNDVIGWMRRRWDGAVWPAHVNNSIALNCFRNTIKMQRQSACNVPITIVLYVANS